MYLTIPGSKAHVLHARKNMTLGLAKQVPPHQLIMTIKVMEYLDCDYKSIYLNYE